LKRYYYILAVLFLLNFSCSNSEIEDNVIGDWTWGERKLSISKTRIVFNDVKEDYIEYRTSADSMVHFSVEVGEGWCGKILSLNSDEIVFYDSLLQKQIKLNRLDK